MMAISMDARYHNVKKDDDPSNANTCNNSKFSIAILISLLVAKAIFSEDLLLSASVSIELCRDARDLALCRCVGGIAILWLVVVGGTSREQY